MQKSLTSDVERLSRILSEDAVLTSVQQSDAFEASGVISITLSDTQKGIFNTKGAISPFDADLGIVRARSSLAQLGIDIFQDGKNYTLSKNGQLEVPVHVAAYGGHREKIFRAFLEESRRSRSMPVGKVIIQSGVPLSDIELQSALNSQHIYAPNATIDHNSPIKNPIDAHLRVPISYIEKYFVDSLFSPHSMANVLEDGRIALGKLLGINAREQSFLGKDDFLVGNFLAHFGTYRASIHRDISPFVRHLSATELHISRGRSLQYEILNTASSPAGKEALSLPISVFPSPSHKSEEITRIFTLYPEALKRGIGPEHILNIKDPKKREELFSLVGDDDQAVLISGGGVRKVPGVKPPTFSEDITEDEHLNLTSDRLRVNANVLEHSASHPHLHENVDESISSHIQEMIGSERTLMVARSFEGLPLNAIDSGVKAVLIRGFANESVFMTQYMYGHLCELWRRGVTVYIDHPHENGFKKWYRCGFIREGAEEKVDSALRGGIIPVYGAARIPTRKLHTSLEKDLHTIIGGFKAFLQNAYAGTTFGISNGAGPGSMAVSNEVCDKEGVTSFGFAISAELFGQSDVSTYNKHVAVSIQIKGANRLARQELIALPSMAAIFCHQRGAGTIEELFIDFNQKKLGEFFLGPCILLTAPDEKKHTYEEALEVLDRMAEEGTTCPKTRGLLHAAASAEEGLRILKEFYRDPISFWKQCGFSKEDILIRIHSVNTSAKTINMPGIPQHFADIAQNAPDF